MKANRQNKVLEIISQQEIETQEELVSALISLGFHVTQATVSRDIKELKLIKIQSESGAYKYAANKKQAGRDLNVLMRIFRDTVVSVEFSMNLIVVKTLSGSANAAAEAIDSLGDAGVLGSIAGDNTIFIATASQEAAAEITSKFLKILNRQESD